MSLKCEVCLNVPHKYKCPRCLKKTCSLACVKVHKKLDECDGQRDKTAHVKIKDFTESHLQNDYNFLEGVCRTADNACRDKTQKNKGRPAFVHRFFNQAKKRGIKLRLLPFPLSKRKNNTSHFDYRTRQITWLTEWKFPSAEAEYKHRFHEDTILQDSLKHFLDPVTSDPVIRHCLKPYVNSPKEDLKIFMKAEARPANDIKYYELDLQSSITENLKGKVVVEYPTFIVVLKNKWDDYSIIEEEECSTKNPDEINLDDCMDEVESDSVVVKPKPLYHKTMEQENTNKSESTTTKEDRSERAAKQTCDHTEEFSSSTKCENTNTTVTKTCSNTETKLQTNKTDSGQKSSKNLHAK